MKAGLFAPSTGDVKRLRFFATAVFAVFVAVAAIVGGFGVVFSVAFGGAVSILNLYYLERFCGIVLSREPNPGVAKLMMAFSFYGRLAAVAISLYYFVNAGWIEFPALFAGLSVAPVSIFVWHFAFGSYIRGEA